MVFVTGVAKSDGSITIWRDRNRPSQPAARMTLETIAFGFGTLPPVHSPRVAEIVG